MRVMASALASGGQNRVGLYEVSVYGSSGGIRLIPRVLSRWVVAFRRTLLTTQGRLSRPALWDLQAAQALPFMRAS